MAGVPIVIVINIGNRTAVVRPKTKGTRIDINGALDAGDVIPGWTLPLRDLFVS